MELADTSAWYWRERSPELIRTSFDRAVLRISIATCDMVRFELLTSARNAAEFRRRREHLDELPDCPIAKEQWRRALWVYERLAEQGGSHQRSVGYGDLLIAAAAESTGATVLHYDEDFERIAEVTGQPTRWLAPRGSL